MKTVALLVPTYNEGSNIDALYAETVKVMDSLKNYAFHLCFIDDGSLDDTQQRIKSLAETDKRVCYLFLSRNFGKEAALFAGLCENPADATIMMDADLQHPPENIPKMLEIWEQGEKVVVMKRKYKKFPGVIKFLGSYFFYKIMNMISDTQMEPNTTDFRLIDKSVREVVLKMTERKRMMRGLIDWTGFSRKYIDFIAPERLAGEAGYTFKKLMALAINSFTNFSLFPLQLAGYSGIFLFTLFFLMFIYMVFDRFSFNYWAFTNISFVIVLNSLMVSFVLICLGLIALYIGGIHTEVLNRPIFIVHEKKVSNAEDRVISNFKK